MPDASIGVAEPSTVTARLDAESVVIGGTTVLRERMQVAGVSSGAIAPVSSASGLLVQVSSLSTLQLSTASVVRVEPVSSGTMTVTGTSNVTATTGSVIRVEPVSSGTMTVTGTSNVSGSTVVLTTASTVSAIVSNSTVSPVNVKIEGSTGTLTVTGTSNVALTTASTGAFKITGGGTTNVANVNTSGELLISGIGTSGGAQGTGLTTNQSSQAWMTRLVDIDSTVGAQVNTSGELAVAAALTLTTASITRVEPVSSGTMTVTGTSNVSGSTVVLTTASTVRVEIAAAGSSITQMYDVNSSAVAVENVLGVSIRLSGANGSSEGGTTASPLAVLLQASTATVTIQGNSTATITTASKVISDFTTATTGRVEISAAVPQSSVTISGGQSTAILTTASVTMVEPVSSGTMTVTGTSNVSGSTILSNDRIQSSQVVSGTTLVAIQYASFGFATSGAQTIVSSALTAIIRVLGVQLVCASTNVLTWFSGTTAGTTLSGPQSYAANGGMVLPVSPHGWFQTSSGVALTLKSEVASSVGGSIVYVQSTAFN